MKRIKKIIQIVTLCMCIFAGGCLIPISSHAQEIKVGVEPRMSYISTYSTNLAISDDGIASIKGEVKGKVGVTSAYVKVTLQKYELGKWVDVESWEDSRNGRSAIVVVDYQVSKGTYRTVMVCSADTESKTATSALSTY